MRAASPAKAIGGKQKQQEPTVRYEMRLLSGSHSYHKLCRLCEPSSAPHSTMLTMAINGALFEAFVISCTK
jgi:hypothetical protein